MSSIATQNVTRDYTIPAIERRISELLKRRVELERISGESIEERLAKYKEKRNNRHGLLKSTHHTVLEIAAFVLNVEPELLEEGIIDRDEYVDTFSSFFKERGKQAIIIHYQYMTPPSIESGRWNPQFDTQKQVLRCCVTDGTSEQFCGKSIIVYRLRSNIEFEAKHLIDETYYAYAEVDPISQSSIAAISDLILRLNQPAIRSNIQWGELSKTEGGLKMANNFRHDFDDFCKFLSTITIDLQGIVKFDVNWDLYNNYLMTPKDIIINAKNRFITEMIENNVRNWMKMMERAIVESQQLRRETEIVGPTGELAYWRRLLIRFSSIIECIKSPPTEAFIELLIHSNSRLMKQWKRLINHVVTVQILAQDNVKYLYTLEKFTQPLYRLNPTKIGKYLPALMYVIRMIYATSRFFNTRRMVTAVFVKMTNQMILACKGYLTNDGSLNIWHDSKSNMISKIKDCTALYEQYHEHYNNMCKKVKESTDEKPFEVSEMYVFGKFKTFQTRLMKIMDVLEITLTYSILESSTLEGIDAYNVKFVSFFQKISSQDYDPLDHRQPYFNLDYDEFTHNVSETEIALRTFFYDTVSVAPNIISALSITKRFQKLNLKCLRIDRKYLELTKIYQKEIEETRDKYNEDRSFPPVPRNIPPIAGRIFWIRQLYRRIETPMDVFKTRKRVITHEYMQKCIKIYNALISVFIHYEIIYHKAWYDSCDIVRLALSAPLLVRHPHTNKYCLNFDIFILEVIEESEHMSKFGLEVPDFIQIITFSKKRIFSSYNVIRNLIEENNELRRSIPIVFLNLIKIPLINLEAAFQPCLSIISWASLKISQICANIEKVLLVVKNFIKEIKDMKEARVDEVLELISGTMLLKIDNYPKSPADFLRDNINFINTVAAELEIKSSMAEKVVITIINKFMDLITDPSIQNVKYDWMDPEQLIRQVGSYTKLTAGPFEPGFAPLPKTQNIQINQVHNDCMELFAFFNNKMMEALVKCTKGSLELLKRKVEITSSLLPNNFQENNSALMLTQFVLQIPNIVTVPSIEELQNNFEQVIIAVMDTHKSIILWGQRYSHLSHKNNPFDGDIKRNLKSYYKIISDHKEIIRITMGLQGVILMLKDDITALGNSYLKYSYIWDEHKEQIIQTFIESEPIIQEIKEKFIGYENLFTELENLPDQHIVGPIEIRMEKLKLALLVEARAWKKLLGSALTTNYRNKLAKIMEYINEKNKILARPIKDLEDVRIAMKCLGTIRDDFITFDMELILIEGTYTLMGQFNIDVLKEEQDLVDSLRYHFNNMLDMAKQVQETICEMQEPLKTELVEGVAILIDDVAQFDEDFEVIGPMVEGIPAAEAAERVTAFQARFDELWNRYETYSSGEILFGIPIREYPELQQRRKELNLLQKLYSLYLQVMRTIDSYYNIPWSDIDIESIVAELAEFQNKCRRLPKAMRDWPAYIDLKKKIDDFNETCPLLEMMANKAMKGRHWEQMSKLCNFFFDIESDTFTLANALEAPLLKYKDDVEDICTSAVKETEIESKLKQVIADWAVVNLQFSHFKQRGELLLKGVETAEIISQLEDSLMVISSLMANRYNAHFKKDIQLWQRKLSNTSEILSTWLTVQNLWAYLEAVFIGGDISKQLPAEAKRFNAIDKSWVKLMNRAHDKLNAVETCTEDETMGQLLPYLLEQLESCQKSLSGYLETKRVIFPRFCFISDPTLLEILGQAADCHTVQNYLDGFFDNLAKLDFSEKDYENIIAMYSREGEKIVLEKVVVCLGGVENWLNTFLSVHQLSVGAAISHGMTFLESADFNITELIDNSVLQVGLIALQVLWTRDSEAAMNASRKNKTIMRKTNEWFLDLLNTLIEVTVKDLTPYARQKYEALITIHVHQRDIFDELYRAKVRSTQDFEWLKQSRFYYDDDKEEILIRITDVEFIYQNEFLGCTDRLVITPLTDRCYITLAQAVGMNFGGAPAGPAGTGKTETTKDMGKALGKYVVVFNCSDQMDFRGLGRIFKGLAQAGVWGCFDEFNRIELPVLSVAAQQIAIVLNARKERKTHFLFSDGETYKLNYELGIFITMNPGYAGRQELPENLKIQFRSVAMMVPDRQIIIRVKLAACGFMQNIILARKFFTLYALCEEQLSKQVHYDFGLRNILSCLRTLGAQKRAHPGESEETTLMRVLRDMNLSKLVDEDEPLFMSLIEDMFPGIKLTTQTYKELQKGISNATIALGITNHPEWNLKAIQLYETSLVRHGLMVLGPTGSGKTRCMWALMKALTEMGTPHKEIRMNPKAITASQMFGKLDVATNDWTDGIFSTIWRRSVQMKKADHLWIVLDGPVDAVWIENLNSVLDDNKTLTLANGDRIIMSPTSKLVFEPDNVDNASPATISRMGMVFVSSSVLKWHSILEAWLKKHSHQEAEILNTLFHKIYDDALTFLQTKLQTKMTLLEALYIRQSLDLLDGLLIHEDPKVFTNAHIEKLFLFSIMWSLGAVLEVDARYALQEFLLGHKSRCHWPSIIEDETIFEYVVSDHGHWVHWNEKVPEFEYPSDHILEYYKILVPNVDNTRTLFLIDIIAKQEKGVLLIGEQGTAKTVMIKSYMSNFDSEYHLQKSFNFSSASTPNMVQRVFESYVEKRVGNTYGPPGGRRLTVFIDDINMPVINEWGDQVTNEIIRQLMEYKGFYSLDKPGDFCTLQDIMILAAMIHPGGGRNDIPPRLKRQFNIFNCTLPSNKSMDSIFGNISQGYFCLTRFPEHIVNFIPKLVPLTRVLWQKTKIKMLPTPAKFHYVFNLRDLSRIWEGILRIERNECKTITILLKLWDHECTRVISDRFTTVEDKNWFHNTLRQTAEEMLGSEFEHYDDTETYFVNFLRDPPEPTGDEPEDFVFEAPKIYEEIPSYEVVITRVKQNMEQFNEYIRGMHLDLVLFHDALVYLIRISRILGVPRGHAMLVGVGGSGKQSLTRLASFIAGFTFFQITLSRIYNVASLMDDLKKLYREAGTISKGLTFIFTDNEIKDEAFLEYINNILSVGEVANLFPKDELDDIYTAVTPLMKKDDPKRPLTQDNLYDYFLTRARNHLHIVLCFSPVGEKFRLRALKFPALISGCTMNWFAKWPRVALYQVGQHVLEPFSMECVPEVKNHLIQVMGDVQDDVNDICVEYFNRFRRQTYVTPKSYLTFLNSYKIIYKQHLDNINMLASRMSSGLNKLVDAAAQVDELRKVLEKNQEEIAVKNIQVESILVTVDEKKREAEVVKARVQVTKNQAEALLKVIAADKKVAEKKLKAAEPALLEAEAALQTIKASDIATVRKLGKPPYLITLIMDCVLILFGKKLERVKPDPERQFLTPSWTEAFKVMTDTRFLYNLQNFPKDNINGEIVDLMYPYLNYPLYTYEAAKQACGNVAGLIQWTIAMVAFYGINKDVLPLKANLAIQEGKYERANRNLRQAEALLREKDEDLKQVQKEYDAVMQERQIIIDQAEACQAKTDTATAMIEGLSGERIRWTDQVALFKSEIERLVGDVVILTGFLSYCGPFNQEIRVLLQRKWFDFLQDSKIPCSVSINIVNVLTDTATIGEWNLQGLPNDELSIQNGIIMTKAIRYPLLIDPQLQGKTWIKNKEKDFELQTTLLSHKYFRNHLEDAVSLGRPLLIEDVGEELDPVLDNLLEKNFIKIGTTFKVKLGDKEVDISQDFRLYITTKLPNPSYTPEVFARISVIDFTVTMKGLEDQLLGRVILTEEEELETERVQLITDVTANKRKITELEANLLHKLTTVQGPLIEDVGLMMVLNTTKQTAAEVNEKLNIARETEIKIDTAREEYRPIATRGSVLYFLICDMAYVNCMYQTSLAQFLERFDISMELSEKSPVIQKRINHVIEYLTYEVFKYKSRGLYEIHKYMFILLMTLKIDLQRGSISHEEFEFFIKGGAALNLNTVEPKPCKWITDVTWLHLVALSALKQFQYILTQVPASEKLWKLWFEKDCPEEEIIPDGYHNLDTFHRLLIIRAWCMDRTLSQSRKYIASSLGPQYAEVVITLLDVMYNESRPNTPMICFLSMGSDPSPSIEQLAKNMEILCKSISMGQGQEIHARKLLSSAMTDGFWVLCQNCHLGLDYMHEMVAFLLAMQSPHPDFRIWITTEPHKDFPISLLQMSIKFTYEPPQGIKAGLTATYSGMNQIMLDQCDAVQYIPLIYAVSFLHTIVQERRKFGPLGWNIPYEFNSADWLASCMFMNNHLSDFDPKRGISWQTVRYMIGEVQYGGRVTDDYDKRLLNTFAKVWFSDAIFTEDFEFYKGYTVLSYSNVAEYLKAIDSMATVDPPQVYGLHSNADITYQTNTTQAVLDTIISIQPKEAGVGGGESREAVVTRQTKEMLEKLPPLYDFFQVRERLNIMGVTQPMNIFLKQEIDRINIILKMLLTMLNDLLLAIEGVIIMNEQLRDILDNVYDARIPTTWKSRSWESSTLGFWFTELLQRNQQYSSWLFSGRPMKFWMTGFFNPQGFLTAMRQEVTRAHEGWALDNVTLHNSVLRYSSEDIKSAPDEGVYVIGLILEGAGWDRRNNMLCESVNKVLYVNMPVVHIYALYNKPDKDPKLYQCPLYKKPQRTYIQLVTPLWLQTNKSPDHWILRGVALLCDNK